MVEVNTHVVMVSIGVVILITWAWKFLNDFWFKPKKLETFMRSQGFKGNPYRFLRGDFIEMIRMTQQAQSKPIKLDDYVVPSIAPFHYKMVQKYGKNCFFWYGPKLHLNITDPDMIKEIMHKHNIFQRPALSSLSKLTINGLVIKEGDEWMKHRKIINPAFGAEKLKNMIPLMYVSCLEVVKKWEELIQEEGFGEIDVWPDIEKLTADVISRTTFGSSYEEGKRIFQLQKEQFVLTHQSLWSNYIKGWRFLAPKMNKRLKEISRETDAIMRDLMLSREKRMENKEKCEDMLGILMESNLQEIQKNGDDVGSGLSSEDVMKECKLFYFAGQETTSNLISWTMIMLGLHLDWQERAREEITQVLGDNQPNLDALNHLKILTMIFNEVLRIFSSASSITRSTRETTKLGDITVPSGVNILMDLVQIHHDPEVWGDDARGFNPERFSEGAAKAAKKPNSYFPFGMGPRICIGKNLATNEAKIAMALILLHFSFKLSPSYEHGPFPKFTLQPRFGVKVILHKLEHQLAHLNSPI